MLAWILRAQTSLMRRKRGKPCSTRTHAASPATHLLALLHRPLEYAVALAPLHELPPISRVGV